MRPKLVIAAGFCLLATAFAQPAHAAYDPLASGNVTLTVEKAFAAYLQESGIALNATAPAKRKGSKLILPVTGGEWDPSAGKGTAETEGSLVFEDARRKVPFREVTVKAKPTPLFAKVGGGQLKVASAKKIAPARAGFGAKLTATKLALTAKVATRLNKKLRPRELFAAGQVIGKLSVQVNPETVTVLPQGRVYLTPTPEIRAKLDSLFVSINPISPAELAPGPVFGFPLAAKSRIAPDASTGTLRTGGALEFLQLGAGQIFWAEPVFDLGTDLATAEVDLRPSPPYPGKLGLLGVLGLGPPAAISSEPAPRRISIAGAPLGLTAETAAAFNQAFGEPQGRADAFHPGEVLGALSFTAQAQ
jgi:hypothetical protein